MAGAEGKNDEMRTAGRQGRAGRGGFQPLSGHHALV